MPNLGGIKAGNAYVVIGAIDDTGKMLSKIGKKLQRWGDGLKNFGLDLGFKTALALTPAALGLNQFIKYEDLMLAVQARTGATAAEMEDLGKKAREMGKDIGISATQIAQSMSELSTRGFNVKQIGDMTRPIALLSKATGKGTEKDMEQAAQLMSLAIQAFKLDTTEALPIANKLTIAANESNFALDDLRESLSHIGPLAHQMGMSLEETVAILAQMRNVEIDAASAGIGLRNILLNSVNTKNAEDFNKALAGFGIGAMEFLDAAGNLKDGAQLIFEVFAKLKNLGTGQRASLLEGLFGKRAITPSIAAGSSEEKFKGLLDKMMNAPLDSSEKIAHKMESGLGGAFRRMVNNVQDLSIAFGQTLSPVLGTVGMQLDKVITSASKWISLNPGLVAGITAATAALLGLAAAMVTMGLTLNVIAPLFSFVGFVITGIQTVAAGLIAGVTGLVGLVWGLGSALIGGAVAGFTMLASGVMTLVPLIIAAGTAVWGLISTLALVGPAAGTAFFIPQLVMLTAVLGFIAILVHQVAHNIGMFAEAGELAGKVWVDTGNNIRQVFGDIKNLIGNVKDFAVDSWVKIADSAVKAGQTIASAFSTAMSLAKIGEYKAAWDVMLAGLKVGFVTLKGTLVEIFTEAIMSIQGAFTMLMLKIDQKARAMKAALLGDEHLVREINRGIKGEDHRQNQRNAIDKKEALDDIKQRNKQEADAADMDLAVERDRANALLANAPDAGKAAVNNLLNNLGGPPPGPGGQAVGMMKPLEGLEKGTLEAAKAAWEGSGDAGQRQLDLLAGILNGLIALNNNLQVA